MFTYYIDYPGCTDDAFNAFDFGLGEWDGVWRVGIFLALLPDRLDRSHLISALLRGGGVRTRVLYMILDSLFYHSFFLGPFSIVFGPHNT